MLITYFELRTRDLYFVCNVFRFLGNVYAFTQICNTRKYYPSSRQFRDPPTYTHQPSMQQKVPFSLIRCSSSKVAFCSCVEWGWHIYNIVESESDPLTRRPVDLFEKEPLKGNSEVHLHTPTKFGEDRSKDLGGDREQTDKQTNAARFIVWYCHVEVSRVLTIWSHVAHTIMNSIKIYICCIHKLHRYRFQFTNKLFF